MEGKIDWSQYEVKDNAQPKVDWSKYQVNDQQASEDDEGIPIPEATGISGAFSDLLGAALSAKDFAEDIPNKMEKLGGNILENPVSGTVRPFGQLAAEVGDIGKGIINAPYSLNQYLARKHLLPQVLGKLGKLIPHLPEDMGVESALGLEPDKEKGDDLIRAIPDIASTVIGGKPLVSQTKRAFKAPDLQQAIRDTQAKVRSVDKNLGKAFDTVESEIDKRGVGKIPVSKDVISQAESLLEKTPEAKDLIARAKTGDFKALRELQADLREIGESALSNKLTTERKVGKEALSTRKQINESIENHLNDTGHKDLAQLLQESKEGYANLQNTYFSNAALTKVFGKSQKVPKNPITLLSEESTEMNRFMKAHPELKDALGKALKHENRKKLRKDLGRGALKVGAGILGYEGLNKLGQK